MCEDGSRDRILTRQLLIVLAGLVISAASISGQVAETIALPLQQNQYDLAKDGQAFLIEEAAKASFFMLGELHGENEIPSLIRAIWPSMWKLGYRHVAAEISPWAADQLEFSGGKVPVFGLWRQSEANFVTSFRTARDAILWGCDIDEGQPHLLLRVLAAANPRNEQLDAAVQMVKSGYQRKMAPTLLQHVQAAVGVKDVVTGGVSLLTSLTLTLEVEADRLAGSALQASNRREAVMKRLFHGQWLNAGKPKVFLRFGRNHLHRGYDRRGVSTLGNFVAELGTAERLDVFNVAAFAGGGKIRIAGPVTDFDEREDDPAFGHLASVARYPGTVFDLRPIRQALHRLPESKRSPIEASLAYWADSYDALIFYREVTPLALFDK